MTRKGVWNLQQLRDKSLQSLWVNNAQVWMCGSNTGDYVGALAQNSTSTQRYSSPVQVFGNNSEWNDIQLSDAGDFVLATKTDGTLWGWGNNGSGQLAQNNRTTYSSPKSISAAWTDAAGNVISFANSASTTAWINSDNELWVVGNGRVGQLGNSKNETTPDYRYSSPVQIPGSWSKIDGGNFFYGAIKTNGELWMWGGNAAGQLGQNETTPNNENGYSSPVQVPGTTWSKLYCHSSNLKAIKTDGTLWVWGINNQAQLGLNNKTSYSSPIQIPGTWANAKFSRGTGSNRFYVESDGSMYQSGQNYNGNIANNTRSDNVYYSSPIQIPGTWSTDSSPYMTNNASVAAIKSDGTAWVWGRNQYSGQFGINNIIDYSSPVQLGGTTEFKWTDVAISQQVFGGIRNTLTGSQE